MEFQEEHGDQDCESTRGKGVVSSQVLCGPWRQAFSEARSGWTLATVLHTGDTVRTERKQKEGERIKWG